MTLKITNLLNPTPDGGGTSNTGRRPSRADQATVNDLLEAIAIVESTKNRRVRDFDPANVDPSLDSFDTDSDDGIATPSSSVSGSDIVVPYFPDDNNPYFAVNKRVSIGQNHEAYRVIPGFLDPTYGKKPNTGTVKMTYRRGPVGNYSHVYDKSSSYIHPADPMETRRQAVNHKISLVARDGRLFLSKLVDTPMKMLFLGIGDGRLLFDVAYNYPFTKIIAVSDKLPNTIGIYVPRNVTFRVANLEQDWGNFDKHWECSYDLILMVSLFDTYSGDLWPLLSKAYTALQPNGCLEVHDHISPTEVTGTEPAWAHRELRGALVERLIPLTNSRCMAGNKMGQSMKSAGFIDVEHMMVRVPSNPHSIASGTATNHLTQQQRREVMCAELVQLNAFDNKVLEKLAQDLFVKGRKWSEERADEWVTEMAWEMEQVDILAYKPYFFTWGRKELIIPKKRTPKIVVVPATGQSQAAPPQAAPRSPASGCDPSGCDLSGCDPSGCDLSGRTPSGSHLSGCDLSGRTPSGSHLSHRSLAATPS
ncbi:hypothetical protein CONLIGDRAFT_679336 [Coniochaeta ligniaria NRRL 30616]|uniref:Methyltransferase domain-containing protein n=1 Tax=Coniochaeta ligniaria NRRL 30616 TaxID=1408157 RepID=A0A1J7ITP7_9PEZI|nr:hypothetical protein CONLIGDRAFT_679336 [Coniochaeta ligniaria NRRL 30616]